MDEIIEFEMYEEAEKEKPSRTGGRTVYSVARLNREIKTLLERSYPTVWVEGEISNLKRHSSGHIYLSLKDSEAQICAVFFSRQNRFLKFQLKDGLKVLASGRPSLYEARGQYQFYIETLEPKGVGALQLAFAQLKEKLYKEGLFDPARKKLIPRFPETVGVVTSPTGAAIRDILNVVNRRFKGTRVVIYPVRVQGEGAAEEIAEGIRDLNRLGGIDVMIVGRGGGSLEDLWAFNEEAVARAVYASEIPVISAVGHEVDWTICDMVADLRAPTPSAAAELVVRNREDVELQIQDAQVCMKKAILNFLETRRSELERFEASYALRQPLDLVQQYSQRVDELLRQLQNYTRALINDRDHRFRQMVGRLGALSPLGILERGYSITQGPEGHPVKDAASGRVGDVLTTLLWRGSIKSRIIEILRPEDDKNG